MKITHDTALKAVDFAIEKHCLDKCGFSEQERERVKTLLSLGAFRAIEFLNRESE